MEAIIFRIEVSIFFFFEKRRFIRHIEVLVGHVQLVVHSSRQRPGGPRRWVLRSEIVLFTRTCPQNVLRYVMEPV